MAARRKQLAGVWINKIVIYNPMIWRIKAGNNGVVVGKREGGEDGDEPFGRNGAAGDEAADVRSRGFEVVAEAEAVEGDEEDDGAGESGAGGGGGEEEGECKGGGGGEGEEGEEDGGGGTGGGGGGGREEEGGG